MENTTEGRVESRPHLASQMKVAGYPPFLRKGNKADQRVLEVKKEEKKEKRKKKKNKGK